MCSNKGRNSTQKLILGLGFLASFATLPVAANDMPADKAQAIHELIEVMNVKSLGPQMAQFYAKMDWVGFVTETSTQVYGNYLDTKEIRDITNFYRSPFLRSSCSR
jgi:hypothetical protein